MKNKTYRFVQRKDRGKAIEPTPGPPCKTLATMTPEERAEMVRLYGPISTTAERRMSRRAELIAAVLRMGRGKAQ